MRKEPQEQTPSLYHKGAAYVFAPCARPAGQPAGERCAATGGQLRVAVQAAFVQGSPSVHGPGVRYSARWYATPVS